MLTGVHAFDESLNRTKVWLKDVQDTLHYDNQDDAFKALRAVLQALRDRLAVSEAADLAAQLPMMLMGMFYHGWNPAGKPEKMRSEEEFLNRVRVNLMPPKDPRQVAKAIFGILEKHITAGEIADIKGTLPKEILALWPSPSEEQH